MAYKIKVSKVGYNVLTDDNPDHLIFSSDYNTLKYYANGSVNVEVYFNAEGYYSFTEEITHGLGYKPFFKAYANWATYSPVGIFTLVDNHNIFISVKVDNNKMYFNVSGYNAVFLEGTNIAVPYAQLRVDWYDQYNDYTGDGSYQCFDLVAQFAHDIGVPNAPGNPTCFPYANAYQIYTDYSGSFSETYFDRIAYSSNTPQLGDIVVWDSGYGGGAGHAGVATGNSNSSNFDCFQQNDPVGAKCLDKNYSYSNVLGWLWLKNIEHYTDPDVIDFTITFKYKIFKNSLGL